MQTPVNLKMKAEASCLCMAVNLCEHAPSIHTSEVAVTVITAVQGSYSLEYLMTTIPLLIEWITFLLSVIFLYSLIK